MIDRNCGDPLLALGNNVVTEVIEKHYSHSWDAVMKQLDAILLIREQSSFFFLINRNNCLCVLNAKEKKKKKRRKRETKRKKKVSRLDLGIFISKLKGGCRNKRQ